MLKLTVTKQELFDEKTGSFINIEKDYTFCIEHSLVAIAKWESIHKKCFLSDKEQKTQLEMLDYVKCMTITQNIPDVVYYGLTPAHYQLINAYMNDSKTASTFEEKKQEGVGRKKPTEQTTSDMIYYYMIACEIPWQAEKWHISRLLKLIEICSIKNKEANKPDKKKTPKMNGAQRAALNRQRCSDLKTHG